MSVRHAAIGPSVLLFASSALWGLATVLSKVLLGTIGPVPLLFVQLLASCGCLWFLCLMLGRNVRIGWDMWPAFLLGVLNPGISYTFSMLALSRIPASVASLFWATEPFFILLLGAIVLKERVTAAAVAMITLGFTGAILVSAAVNDGTLNVGDGIGYACMLVAVVLCAIYTVYSRRVGTEHDPIVLVTLQQTAGLIWATGLLAAQALSGVPTGLSEVPTSELLGAGLTGIVYYALAYWLYLAALGRVSAALAGASFNFIPVVAIAAAFVILGERLQFGQWIGVALILASGFLLVRLTSGTRSGP